METPELGATTELAGSLVIGGLKEQPDGSMQWEHGEVRNQARFDAKGAERPHEEQGRVAARYLGVFFSLDLNWSKTVGRLKSSVGLAMARLRQARAPHWVQHEVMLAMVASRAAFAAQVAAFSDASVKLAHSVDQTDAWGVQGGTGGWRGAARTATREDAPRAQGSGAVA